MLLAKLIFEEHKLALKQLYEILTDEYLYHQSKRFIFHPQAVCQCKMCLHYQLAVRKASQSWEDLKEDEKQEYIKKAELYEKSISIAAKDGSLERREEIQTP